MNVEIEELIIFGEIYIKVMVYNCRINMEYESIFDLLLLNVYLLY